MTLDKISLELTYKILSHVQVKDFNKYSADVKILLLAAMTNVYIKARHDELNSIAWDEATIPYNTNIPT